MADAYDVFHGAGVPFGVASISGFMENKIGELTVKDYLNLIVADGGEVLVHYSGNLTDDSTDEQWQSLVVNSKRAFESNGFTARGLILADSSTRNSNKWEKYCRKYYDYADKVGKSPQYKLGRMLMLNYSSLDSFLAHIDTCLTKNGMHAFGFHGTAQAGEEWITKESLQTIIQRIKANGGEITTYSALSDKFGSNALMKRIEALEA